MQPMPPALETAAARGPPEVRAMPARRIGCWMPRRVVSGVVIGAMVMRRFVDVWWIGWLAR